MPENSWDCIYFDPITPKLNFPWFAKIIGYFEPHLIIATVVSFIISQKIYKLAVSPNLYISYINILYAFFKIWKCYLFARLVVLVTKFKFMREFWKFQPNWLSELKSSNIEQLVTGFIHKWIILIWQTNRWLILIQMLENSNYDKACY